MRYGPPDGLCAECGKPCFGVWVDFGIGAYEYWGHRGVDKREEWVSECCEATVQDESGCAVEPVEPYEPDYEAEC